MNPHWILVTSQQGKERLATQNIGRQGYEWYLPMIRENVTRQGHKIELAKPLFPRYIFVKIVSQWSSLTGTYGVNGVVMDGKSPRYVPERIVEGIKKREDENGFVRLDEEEGLRKGNLVKVIATMNPGPDVIEGYVNALTHGASTTAIPEAVRAKVISSMTDDQWKQYEDAQKKGIIGSASSGYYQLQDDGTYQLLVPGTGNNTNNGLSKPLTSSQIQKLETSGVFNQQDVQSIQKYIENGGDLSTLTFDNPDQTKVWQTVLGGTTSTIPTKGSISSALQQLQTQYGTSNKWSQDDWATRKADFLSQYPNDTSTASSAFTTMFPKPAAPKSAMTVIGDVFGQGLQDLQGLMPKF